MQVGPVNEFIKPIAFLIGKWKAVTAKGKYPTIQPFEYNEEIEFVSVGQPILNYKSTTWHPVKKSPMHLESGFLRIKPETNQLAFMVAHNFGLTSLEEGCVEEYTIKLKTSHISRMSFAKEPGVVAIERIISYVEQNKQLHVLVNMETANTPLQEHLNIVYEKI